ncbi:MAG: GNAT family N-acetyltransferase [Candidatus Acidiferrales bacterium]
MTGWEPHCQISIRPLVENDLAEAELIVRLAFGTFLGLPDPTSFMGDAEFVRTRWKADPAAALAAESAGHLLGSNFLANWGSFAFFGPLTILPEYWNRGMAQQLLAPTMDIFKRWGSRHLGLYTFPNSPKHVALYQKFGFWPRDLIAVMAKEITAGGSATQPPGTLRLSGANQQDRDILLKSCREVTSTIFDGLDVSCEIRSVANQSLGDTILVSDGSKLGAFGVCHVGARTEAGSDICYIKFAAARPGPHAPEDFERLLASCEAYAVSHGARKLTAGVNLGCREAFRKMRARKFQTEMLGLAMESGDSESGYNRASVHVLGDWR